MEKRFEFLIGVHDNQEDSTSIQHITRSQMKAIALALNLTVRHTSSGDVSIAERHFFKPTGDGLLEAIELPEDEFLSELKLMKEKFNDKFLPDDDSKQRRINKAFEIQERTLKCIDDLP